MLNDFFRQAEAEANTGTVIETFVIRHLIHIFFCKPDKKN